MIFSDESFRVIQVTDCHITERAEVRVFDMDSHASLVRVLRAAKRRDWPPAFLLATGDLVETGSECAYRRLRRLLEPLGVPVYCLPGNHDDPDIMSNSFASGSVRTVRAFGFGAWRFVLLDSVVPGVHGGHLDDGALDELDGLLGGHEEAPTLVALHHHPVAIQSAWMDAMGLDNGDDLFARLDRHPQVKAVLWGHTHQPFEGERRGVRLIGSPSTCRQFLRLRDEPAFSDEPPAYRRLLFHPDGRFETELCWVDAAE
ncbi:MAG: phosphodiesterase [Alphaproteobacteria bacterium]